MITIVHRCGMMSSYNPYLWMKPQRFVLPTKILVICIGFRTWILYRFLYFQNFKRGVARSSTSWSFGHRAHHGRRMAQEPDRAPWAQRTAAITALINTELSSLGLFPLQMCSVIIICPSDPSEAAQVTKIETGLNGRHNSATSGRFTSNQVYWIVFACRCAISWSYDHNFDLH